MTFAGDKDYFPYAYYIDVFFQHSEQYLLAPCVFILLENVSVLYVKYMVIELPGWEMWQ